MRRMDDYFDDEKEANDFYALHTMQVTSQSHSSVVGQTVGVVAAHHGHPLPPAHAAVHAVPAVAAAHHGHGHAVPAVAHHAHAGHASHVLGKREAPRLN